MIRCFAIDSEMLSLAQLEDNIYRVPFLQLAGHCNDPYDAVNILRQEPVDLLFMDIDMPGLTSRKLLQSLSFRPMVIFITTHREYALDGFELDAVDYLIKPVTFERFLKAVHKAAAYHSFKFAQTFPATVKPVAPLTDYFFVNVVYDLIKVVINDITYIEGLKDYIRIYRVNESRPVITRLSIKTLADRLSSAKFVRVHKSYIVAIDKISSIRRTRIYIEQHSIPIGDFYRESLFSIIGPHSLNSYRDEVN